MALTQSQVSQLYVTLFGRASEGAGNSYWQAASADLVNGADQMLATQAAADYFGNSLDSDLAFVEHIYLNTLNKTYAQDSAGIDYWVSELAAGKSRGQVVSDLISAVYDYSASTDPVTKAAYDQFVNRVTVSDYCANTLSGATLDASDPAAMAPFVSYNTMTTNDPATVVTAEASIDAGNAFVLTNDTDIATANMFTAGLVYTPGGNDRINALQDEDVLTGTGINPTLNATLGNANDNGAVIVTPKLNGIETVNVAFTGSGAAVTALDMQDSTGLAAINITRISQAANQAEVGNIMTAAASLSLSNTNANATGVAEFSYGAGVLAGDNTGAMTVSNVQVGWLNIGENTSLIAARGVGVNGFENLTLVSDGAAANTIGTLNLPMDTGTAGVLTITGDADLTLGQKANVVNITNNALVEAEGVWVAGTGVAQAGGRIATIDASGLTGNLNIVLDNILDVGKANTSGVVQNVTVTGGTGDDTFVLYDAVQAGDSIDGGEGNDTLLFYTGASLASVVANVEAASMLADGSTAPAQIALDYDFLPSATGMTVRNISAVYPVGGPNVNADEANVNFLLSDMTAAQAAAITIQHSTTGNGQIDATKIEAAVKANTASDLLGVTIAEGTNVDQRFNFTIDTAVALGQVATSTTAQLSTIESITLTDADSESNSVLLANFTQHTGTITMSGGVAGTYLNLDTDVRGTAAIADVTAVTTGITADNGDVQHGFLGLDVSGGLAVTGVNSDFVAGNFFDVGASLNEVRLGAATITAAAEVSNVIVRVSTNAASVVGAQAITMGSGNDVVIFDNLNDTRAGLTISDTVVGGLGTDTLVLDGDAVRITLGASEWTNVSGFETIHAAGNGAVAIGNLYGQNAYNLTLTNDLIDGNGSDMINIVNDNDISNDAASGVNTASTGVNQGMTIDARTLNAQNHFTYNGEEGIAGVGMTVDRFILADANINGGNIIDGGAMDNVILGAAITSTDILEVRNTANVTVGDLANIKNVGVIAATNDQATVQTMSLQLNDTIVDALVDSYHVSSTTQVETLAVRVNDALDITAPLAGTIMNFDGSQLTAKSNVTIALDNVNAQTGDSVQLGFGAVYVNTLGFDAVGTLGAGTADGIVLSAAQFGINVAAVGTAQTVTGNNVVYGALGTGAVTDRIYVVENASSLAGAAAFDTQIYYDADGSGAGAAVLIGVIVDNAAGVIGGVGNTGLTIIA